MPLSLTPPLEAAYEKSGPEHPDTPLKLPLVLPNNATAQDAAQSEIAGHKHP